MSALLVVALAATACRDATAPQVEGPAYDLIFESTASPLENQSQLFHLANGATTPVPLLGAGQYAAQPKVSADGRWVAFMAPEPSSLDDAIWLARTDGTASRRIFLSPGSALLRPAPSPDGSRIAFQMYGESMSDSRIWIVNADGTNAHAITTAAHDAPYVYVAPAWSPDGSRLAIAVGTPGNLGLAIVSADGGAVTRLTQPASGSDTEPSWSPDGRQLVFVHSATPAQADVITLDLATGERRTLYTGNGRHPAWSPAGNLIAFSARLNGEPNELFVISPSGGTAQRITTNDVADRHPNWVPRNMYALD